MHHLIVRRTINSPHKKADATGAFIPESEALKELLEVRGGTVEMISLNECPPYRLMSRYKKQDTCSIFCHGWPRRVEALPRRKRGARDVAIWLKASGCEFLNLFACNAADADNKRGCFAEYVADHCHRIGHTVQVFGHETSGHTTWNPKARYYWATPQGVTTTKLFDPEVDGWAERANFSRRLKGDQEYRLLLPFIFDDVNN